MGTGRTDEFRKAAVRIALTSVLLRRQIADDLGDLPPRWSLGHKESLPVCDRPTNSGPPEAGVFWPYSR